MGIQIKLLNGNREVFVISTRGSSFSLRNLLGKSYLREQGPTLHPFDADPGSGGLELMQLRALEHRTAMPELKPAI